MLVDSTGEFLYSLILRKILLDSQFRKKNVDKQDDISHA